MNYASKMVLNGLCYKFSWRVVIRKIYHEGHEEHEEKKKKDKALSFVV